MKLTVAALVGLVLVTIAGCGSQDRYQVTNPPTYMEILDGEFAAITRLPSLHNDTYSGRSAEVDGVMYFYASSGVVYRATDSGYETLPFIPGFFVQAMVA